MKEKPIRVEEQELNEKLNKFAGFQRLRTSDGNYHWFDAEGNIVSPVDEKGNVIWDMNACFKWLVSNFPIGIRLRMLGQLRNDKGYFCSIDGKYLAHHYSEAETPALALRLTIEKLIDS